jgi:hypothetical protein
LAGTGIDQWWRLLQFIRAQGVIIERLLIIAISDDFKRKSWNWPAFDLDCLDYDITCPNEDRYPSQAVRLDETQQELIERTRTRYANRFPHETDWNVMRSLLKQHSMLLKFVALAGQNLSAVKILKAVDEPRPGGGWSFRPENEAALEKFKTLGIPINVLLVPQRVELGLLGSEADLAAAVAVLKAHELSYDWCRLTGNDFMSIDGHPNAAGYDKLAECADRALSKMQ